MIRIVEKLGTQHISVLSGINPVVLFDRLIYTKGTTRRTPILASRMLLHLSFYITLKDVSV